MPVLLIPQAFLHDDPVWVGVGPAHLVVEGLVLDSSVFGQDFDDLRPVPASFRRVDEVPRSLQVSRHEPLRCGGMLLGPVRVVEHDGDLERRFSHRFGSTLPCKGMPTLLKLRNEWFDQGSRSDDLVRERRSHIGEGHVDDLHVLQREAVRLEHLAEHVEQRRASGVDRDLPALEVGESLNLSFEITPHHQHIGAGQVAAVGSDDAHRQAPGKGVEQGRSDSGRGRDLELAGGQRRHGLGAARELLQLHLDALLSEIPFLKGDVDGPIGADSQLAGANHFLGRRRACRDGEDRTDAYEQDSGGFHEGSPSGITAMTWISTFISGRCRRFTPINVPAGLSCSSLGAFFRSQRVWYQLP